MTRQVPPSDGWFRNPYYVVDLSIPGAHISDKVPAALIRVRALGTPSLAGEGSKIKTYGVLDTGASGTVIPLWALRRLGIVADERSKFKMLGVSGWIGAYRVKIGLEVFHDGAWIDLGSMGAVSPDGETSRDSRGGLQILLGRRDFFKKFHLLLDEPNKDAWLRKIA